jgi:hypothetical protein
MKSAQLLYLCRSLPRIGFEDDSDFSDWQRIGLWIRCESNPTYEILTLACPVHRFLSCIMR